jgi:molybdopterin-guanine dinucleotide biosynthesis protein A
MNRRRESAEGASTVVAVLAGGLGSRLGRQKATVMLAGHTLISYPLRAAANAGLEAFVVAKRDSELPALDVMVVREPERPRHPLCGIVTAVRHVASRDAASRVLVLACDMPFVAPELLCALAAGEAESAVAEAGEAVQPLPALIAVSQHAALAEALAHERSLRATIAQLSPRILGEDQVRAFGDPSRLFFSVNRCRDLDAAEAMIAR